MKLVKFSVLAISLVVMSSSAFACPTQNAKKGSAKAEDAKSDVKVSEKAASKDEMHAQLKISEEKKSDSHKSISGHGRSALTRERSYKSE